MSIRVEQQSGVAKVFIEGNLTTCTVDELQRQLIEIVAANDELELNLNAVGEIDAAGFQLLLQAKREAARLNKHLNVTDASLLARTMLQLLNIDGYFDAEREVVSSSSRGVAAGSAY